MEQYAMAYDTKDIRGLLARFPPGIPDDYNRYSGNTLSSHHSTDVSNEIARKPSTKGRSSVPSNYNILTYKSMGREYDEYGLE